MNSLDIASMCINIGPSPGILETLRDCIPEENWLSFFWESSPAYSVSSSAVTWWISSTLKLKHCLTWLFVGLMSQMLRVHIYSGPILSRKHCLKIQYDLVAKNSCLPLLSSLNRFYSARRYYTDNLWEIVINVLLKLGLCMLHNRRVQWWNIGKRARK